MILGTALTRHWPGRFAPSSVILSSNAYGKTGGIPNGLLGYLAYLAYSAYLAYLAPTYLSSVIGLPLCAGSRGSMPAKRLASVYQRSRAGSCQLRRAA